MLNNKNVSFNHTLEEYKRKYGNSTKLKKVTKLEVDKNSSLLDHKHWWFIDNTYYEVPAKKNIVAWWSALPKAAQIAACAIAGVGVVSAVVFPTLAVTVWKKGTDGNIPAEEYLILNSDGLSIKPEARTSGKYPKNMIIPKTLKVDGVETSIVETFDFSGLDKLESIDFSLASELKFLGNYDSEATGFKDCSKLKRVKLNDGLVQIGLSCHTPQFYNCISLEEINIPSTLKSIGQNNFNTCIKLKTVTVDSQDVADYYSSTSPTQDISLYANASTVYIKNTITLNNNAYVSTNFTKQGTSDKDGYNKYLRNGSI